MSQEHSEELVAVGSVRLRPSWRLERSRFVVEFDSPPRPWSGWGSDRNFGVDLQGCDAPGGGPARTGIPPPESRESTRLTCCVLTTQRSGGDLRVAMVQRSTARTDKATSVSG